MASHKNLRLLIIEDEPSIALALSHALGNEYTIDLAHDGELGIRKSQTRNYDTILLDLNLPDMAGLEVCEELRLAKNETPILILTGEAKIVDKVTLLDAGADDYLTKPFNIDELRARIRVLIRRNHSNPATSSKLIAGDLILDRDRHSVERAGQVIPLRLKEFTVLECLMNHAGRVVTRDILLNYAWDGNRDIWTNAIDVHIKYLRDKIDRPFAVPLIKTVHGLGYKLDASNVVAELTP